MKLFSIIFYLLIIPLLWCAFLCFKSGENGAWIFGIMALLFALACYAFGKDLWNY